LGENGGGGGEVCGEGMGGVRRQRKECSGREAGVEGRNGEAGSAQRRVRARPVLNDEPYDKQERFDDSVVVSTRTAKALNERRYMSGGTDGRASFMITRSTCV